MQDKSSWNDISVAPKQRKTLYAAIYNVYDSAAATYLFHATIVFESLVDLLLSQFKSSQFIKIGN